MYILFAIVFYIHALVMYVMGINRIKEYYHSDDYSSLDKYAYVGGDAYNYIINATMQNSYIVVGTGSLIVGSLFIATHSIVRAIKQSKEQQKEIVIEQKLEETNN